MTREDKTQLNPRMQDANLSNPSHPVAVQDDEEFVANERMRVIRDGLINNSGFVVSGAVGILMVPLMLWNLGPESYGLWIAMLTVAGLVSSLNLGISWSLTKEVASAISDRAKQEVAPLVNAAGAVYLIYGVVGAVVVATLGWPFSRELHLSGQTSQIGPTVFVFGGFAFLADQLVAFTTAVFHGLRRFDVVNIVSTIAVLARAAGFLVLFAAGTSLLPIAVWNAAVVGIAALVALAILTRLEPRFILRWRSCNWRSLRASIPYGLASQFVMILAKFIWDAGPLIIGFMRGSSWIAHYHVGQKFPLAASGVSWSAAAVLFPAASEHDRTGNLHHLREVLRSGTRWICVWILPICLVLFVLAPNLLQAWIGDARSDSVLVLRLTAGAVLADGLGVGALHVLWGLGQVRRVLYVLASFAILYSALSVGLLMLAGIVGVSVGLFAVVTGSSIALLHLACRACRLSLRNLCLTVWRDLLLPAVACVATVSIIASYAGRGQWPDVVGAAVAGCAAYGLSFYIRGGTSEERILIRQALAFPTFVVRSSCRELRRIFSRVAF